ncbi:MAG: 50S ribosomal protein L29 [Eubacteriales bacterium]|nr:50S ribosomal protein L29 [Eubacteriales bacterium]MDD3881651.1 50S ribosomal protein L29 [Eubacteriales bacterium]MDD4512290.1 50S ribosomal protein L29 [Eubacteriales bacterium]
MKTSEFAAMDKVQLEAKVKELKESLFQLRFQLATGQLQNTMQISATKRDIARALTQLSKSELKEQA